MKICPLVTQASILDDKDLLVGELDDVESGPRREEPAAGESSPFINPESKLGPETPLLDEIAPTVAARFIGKSYRGRVECLGELCRFHDDEAVECRLERAMKAAAAAPGGDSFADLRGAVERALAERASAQNAIRPLIEELESKHGSRIEEFAGGFERKLDDLKELVRTTADEKDKSIEAFSLTLDARSEEIERKIESSARSLEAFREEIASWKEALMKNVNGIETGVRDNRKLMDELSQNHAGIMQVVENQKRDLDEEERKRRVAEARRLNNSGVMAYHSGQYEKALEQFRKAIELDPSMTEGYNNLGLAYTEMNEEEKATEAFKKAITLNPGLAAAYNNLGYVFYRLGSYREAIEMYNEAIGRSADSSSAYTNLGNAYYKLDRIEDAIDAWRKALSIDPANEKAKRNLKRYHADVK